MNFLLLIAYLYLVNVISSLHSRTEEKEHVVHTTVATTMPIPSKLMGIEIETSAIKIKSPSDDKIGFNFYNLSDGSCIWTLEEDTYDATFENTAHFEEFDRNIEIKTHKGFNFVAINEIMGDIEDAIISLYESAVNAPFVVDRQTLEALQNQKYRVLPKEPSQTQFLIKSKQLSWDNRTINPQITYQLPLQDIFRVFQRLKDLKHKRVTYFLDDLSGAPIKIANSASILSQIQSNPLKKVFEKMAENKDLGALIRQYFNQQIAPHYAALPAGRVKGLITLFLYYWYELFNNKRATGPEPGLKQFLGIMSRIPFSQLYDRLEENEKKDFQNFMAPHLNFGNQCKLRPYINDNCTKIDGIITLKQWFESIVDVNRRILFKTRKVDLLSPPPEMADHSMGILDINSHANGFALIEVRGYSSIEYGDRELTINRIRELGVGESVWFFEILKGRKK